MMENDQMNQMELVNGTPLEAGLLLVTNCNLEL